MEIQLHPGSNVFGRAPGTEFKLDDPSVSGTHCQFMVADGDTRITDLGSTNGTFVDQSPVREALLKPGQTIRLGGFEMLFDADAPARPAAVPLKPARLTATSLTLSAEPAVEAEPPLETLAPTGPVFCKSHIKSPAQWMCRKCNRYFCSLCVGSRRVGNVSHHFCRACGSECVPLQQNAVVRPALKRNFFALLPDAFKYPFKGDGIILLITGTLFYFGMDSARFFARFAGLFGLVAILIITIFGFGYLFSYMRRIITSSALGEDLMPDWPEFSDWGSDIIAPLLQFIATILVCFGPAIGLTIWATGGQDIVALAIIPAVILGCIYFPMGFLAVAMFDTVAALNPLYIVPAIVRVPLEYAVVWLIFGVIIGVGFIRDLVLDVVIPLPIVPAIISGFLGLYFLTVEMRILGLMYFAKKDRFGWLT